MLLEGGFIRGGVWGALCGVRRGGRSAGLGVVWSAVVGVRRTRLCRGGVRGMAWSGGRFLVVGRLQGVSYAFPSTGVKRPGDQGVAGM